MKHYITMTEEVGQIEDSTAARAGDEQARAPVRVLGFDYGLSHIGIASGQTITATATPQSPVSAVNGTPDWDKLVEFVRSWDPHLLVVGLPLLMNGGENPMSRAARKFARQLSSKCVVPCVMTDERLSSFSAEREVLDATPTTHKRNRKPKQTQSTHSIAACVILDTWFSLPEETREELLKNAYRDTDSAD